MYRKFIAAGSLRIRLCAAEDGTFREQDVRVNEKPMDDRIKNWLVPPVLIPLVIVVWLAFLAVLSC